MFFAISKSNGNIGFGNSLEEAMFYLEEGGATLSDISFYEGTEVQVELVVKQVPKKITSHK